MSLLQINSQKQITTFSVEKKIMSNMNGRRRKRARRFLIERDGNVCKKCRVSGKKKKLVIDHIDNNNSNNNYDNMQLLCYACNYKKNPRLKERIQPLDVCVSVKKRANPFEKSEIAINEEKEPQFRLFVEHVIEEHGEFELEDLINSGAEVVKISIITAKRHLKKMTSSYGAYQIITKDGDDFVTKRN